MSVKVALVTGAAAGIGAACAKQLSKDGMAIGVLDLDEERCAGTVDAIYTQSKVFQHLQEATGKFKAIEDLSRYPDWTLQVANIPAAITGFITKAISGTASMPTIGTPPLPL